MITYDIRNWVSILVRVRGTVLPRIAGRVVLVALVAGAVTVMRQRGGHDYGIPVTVHTIVGVALGLLLVFRTNSSHSRYWEGRVLLGGMVNACRDLARQSRVYLAEEATEAREDMARYIGALYASVRRSLRDEREWPELAGALSPDEIAQLAEVRSPPLLVASWISETLAREARQGRLSEERLRMFDGNVGRMIDYWGGCERILRTPVPFAYAHHIKGFLTLFCLTVPFALLDSMGWYTPLAAAVVSYAMFGIDEIGVEIEDPFGYDPNDLPLDGIGDTIGTNVTETLRPVSA